MPVTEYTSAQKRTLQSIDIPRNFVANSFSFYDKSSNTLLEDVIRTDELGNLIFKDAKTEVFLKDLIKKDSNIFERSVDGKNTLYFKDKNNKEYTLGEIYENLFINAGSNYIHWFHERAAKELENGLDGYIIDNYFEDLGNIGTDGEQVYHINEDWKNKWMDIPCMYVITPEYVNGKIASISAVVHFKVKSKKELLTGFRLYDATTGHELQRVIHRTTKKSNDYVTYSVPLHYQGPLPDTDIPANVLDGLDYRDLANVQVEEGSDKALAIFQNSDEYEFIPKTKHVIRLQWITCDMGVEFDESGRQILDYGRYFDPRSPTSMDVTVFNGNPVGGNISLLTGIVDTRALPTGSTTYTHVFDTIPFGLGNEYSVTFSCDKNVKVNIISRSFNGFTIEWERVVDNLTIDWTILYKIEDLDEDEFKQLHDKNRRLNHSIFLSPRDTLDFCNEVVLVNERIDFIPPSSSSSSKATILECECCECCDSSLFSVAFEHVQLTDDDVEPPECFEGGPTNYEYLEDDNDTVLYKQSGSSWGLKAVLQGDDSDSDCRTGILSQQMYNNIITSGVTNPILPKQLIVDPGEKLYVLSIPTIDCNPSSGGTEYNVFTIDSFVSTTSPPSTSTSPSSSPVTPPPPPVIPPVTPPVTPPIPSYYVTSSSATSSRVTPPPVTPPVTPPVPPSSSSSVTLTLRESPSSSSSTPPSLSFTMQDTNGCPFYFKEVGEEKYIPASSATTIDGITFQPMPSDMRSFFGYSVKDYSNGVELTLTDLALAGMVPNRDYYFERIVGNRPTSNSFDYNHNPHPWKDDTFYAVKVSDAPHGYVFVKRAGTAGGPQEKTINVLNSKGVTVKRRYQASQEVIDDFMNYYNTYGSDRFYYRYGRHLSLTLGYSRGNYSNTISAFENAHGTGRGYVSIRYTKIWVHSNAIPMDPELHSVGSLNPLIELKPRIKLEHPAPGFIDVINNYPFGTYSLHVTGLPAHGQNFSELFPERHSTHRVSDLTKTGNYGTPLPDHCIDEVDLRPPPLNPPLLDYRALPNTTPNKCGGDTFIFKGDALCCGRPDGSEPTVNPKVFHSKNECCFTGETPSGDKFASVGDWCILSLSITAKDMIPRKGHPDGLTCGDYANYTYGYNLSLNRGGGSAGYPGLSFDGRTRPRIYNDRFTVAGCRDGFNPEDHNCRCSLLGPGSYIVRFTTTKIRGTRIGGFSSEVKGFNYSVDNNPIDTREYVSEHVYHSVPKVKLGSLDQRKTGLSHSKFVIGVGPHNYVAGPTFLYW